VWDDAKAYAKQRVTDNIVAKLPVFKVTDGPCQTSQKGRCISSVVQNGGYSNRENCKFQVLLHAKLVVHTFVTERGYDKLYVYKTGTPLNGKDHVPSTGDIFHGDGGSKYGGSDDGHIFTVPDGEEIGPDTKILWKTDGSHTKKGFNICAGESSVCMGLIRG